MSETDRRLKDQLNANQAGRERMCAEILRTIPGYSDVRPRLPKGGPDGGRDLACRYIGELCFGAVGFVNDATDTQQHRTQIENKFGADLESAADAVDEAGNKAKAFVFFTNVGLTPTIIDVMKTVARQKGMTYCDVFDRERLRLALDSNKGYAIRLRYLDIGLSDAEQKDFFSTWGDEINAMVSRGFSEIDTATKRIQFLLEAQVLVDSISVVLHLDQPLASVSGGNFLFETSISLRTHSDGVLGYRFGGGSDPIVETLEQWEASGRGFPRNAQYGYSFAWLIPGTPQYENYWELRDKEEARPDPENPDADPYVSIGGSTGILEIEKKTLSFRSGSEPFLFRTTPTFKLFELDGCLIIFHSTKALAEHVEAISIHANGYQLGKFPKGDFKIENSDLGKFHLPKDAKPPAGSDYVTIRPSNGSSCFTLDLMHDTPRRYNWS